MKVTPPDGNIFADLGFADGEKLKAKAELVIQIIQIIEERGLKQVEAAEIMGVDQPKVSQLVRGKLDGFSMERLYRFLNALGMDIEIVVKPTPKSRKAARLSVTPTAGRSRVRQVAKVLGEHPTSLANAPPRSSAPLGRAQGAFAISSKAVTVRSSSSTRKPFAPAARCAHTSER